MKSGFEISERICPICGKIFVPAPMHVYKIKTNTLVCTWSCLCRYEREKERGRKGKKGDSDGCT